MNDDAQSRPLVTDAGARAPGHTTGPWQAIASVDGFENYFIKAQPSPALRGFTKIVASVDGPQEAEQEANARLIAAAPDLFAALKAMVDRWEPDCIGTDRRMWEEACAAIAKAQGARAPASPPHHPTARHIIPDPPR